MLPDGGMAIWFNCDRDASKVAAEAARRGVYVVPENFYRLTPTLGPNSHVRLGYANQTRKEIREGIELFLSCLVC